MISLFVGDKMLFFEKAKEVVRQADQFLTHQDLFSFPDKAKYLLESAKLHESYDLKSVISESLKHEFSTPQKYPHFEFSDFPLTIAQGEHCFIDLYCWRRRPTSIHHHHFVGAFQCLSGENLDWTYEYQETKKLGDFHSIGNLNLIKKQSVLPGDIVPIKWQEDFIHQNLHDADLTVNICLRTHDRTGAYLSDYLSSGLKTIKHPMLIERGERLYHSLFLSSMSRSQLNLNLDESIFFLTQTYGYSSQGSAFLKLRKELSEQLLSELHLDVDQLCREHENHLNNLE